MGIKNNDVEHGLKSQISRLNIAKIGSNLLSDQP